MEFRILVTVVLYSKPNPSAVTWIKPFATGVGSSVSTPTAVFGIVNVFLLLEFGHQILWVKKTNDRGHSYSMGYPSDLFWDVIEYLESNEYCP